MNTLEIATIYIRSLVAIPSLAAIAMYGMYLQQMTDTVLGIIVMGIVSCVLMEVYKEAQAAKAQAAKAGV
jgi:hypothetical protein